MAEANTSTDAVIQMEAYNAGDLFPNFERNTKEQTLLHQHCSEWFSRHIDRLAHESAASSDSIVNRITWINLAVVRSRLKVLLSCLGSGPDTSLRTVTALGAWDQGSAASTGSDEQQHPNPNPNPGLLQAAFLLLGWLSMIYEPKLAPHQSRFEIVLPNKAATVKLSSRFRKQPRWQVPTESIEIERYAAMSFPQLLPHFGLRLPTTTNDPDDGGDSPSFGNTVGHPQIDNLVTASNIYYSNLHRVDKIRVQWVHDIVHHLDFDERNRTLSVFAFPTYCALICLSDPQSTQPLSRLISDDMSLSPPGEEFDDDSGTDDGDETRNQPFDNYCREVLITLGIIFAQEGRSRKEVLKRADGNWRTPADPAWQSALQGDAVMRDMCTKRWREHLFFDYLESPPIRSNYSPRVDFPYLGEKLLRLQAYMETQSPNDFRTLIFDRRDPLRFWTFVLAIGIGGVSLVLNLVQIGLTAAQLAH